MVQNNYITCRICSAEVELPAKFCGMCGTALDLENLPRIIKSGVVDSCDAEYKPKARKAAKANLTLPESNKLESQSAPELHLDPLSALKDKIRLNPLGTGILILILGVGLSFISGFLGRLLIFGGLTFLIVAALNKFRGRKNMGQQRFVRFPPAGRNYNNLAAEVAEKGSIDFYQHDSVLWLTECVRCRKGTPIFSRQAREITEAMGSVELCPNCGGKNFSVGQESPTQSIGVYCRDCRKGYSRWTCSSCGTDNTVVTTFGQIATGSCFIATCVYENPFAPEVGVLRRFRDVHLECHLVGRIFVKCYYTMLPSIARLIGRNDTLKKWTRVLLIQPLVNLLKRWEGV